MTELTEHMKRDVLEPVFWGLIVALISLPFYLSLSVPQIGNDLGVSTIHAFLIPGIISFLASALLGEREMKSGIIMMFSSAIFLIVLLLIVLLLPQITGAVYFMDMYYIDIAKKLIVAFIMFFPSILVGGVIGRVFGDAYVSDTTRSERKRLNMEMREWKETLEKAIMESERGNVSEKELEKEGQKSDDRHLKTVDKDASSRDIIED